MPAMKSASADAESSASIAAATSAGTPGKSWITVRARSRNRLTRASISGVSDLRDADLLDPRGQKGKAGDIFDDAEAAHALADRMMGAVGRGDIANDSRDRSDRMQMLGVRVFDSRVGLQQDADHALGADGFLGSGDRRRPADGHG